MDDADLLGPPRSCRRLPAAVWALAAPLLAAAVAAAVLVEALA